MWRTASCDVREVNSRHNGERRLRLATDSLYLAFDLLQLSSGSPMNGTIVCVQLGDSMLKLGQHWLVGLETNAPKMLPIWTHSYLARLV